MMSVEFLSFCVCICLSLFIFAIFYIEFQIASKIISFAARRNVILCVMLLIISLILSPIALLVACIKDNSLINKAIIAMFLVTSVILSFNMFDVICNEITSQILNYQIQNI